MPNSSADEDSKWHTDDTIKKVLLVFGPDRTRFDESRGPSHGGGGGDSRGGDSRGGDSRGGV